MSAVATATKLLNDSNEKAMKAGDIVKVKTILPTKLMREDVRWAVGLIGVVSNDSNEGEVEQVAFVGHPGKAYQFLAGELELNLCSGCAAAPRQSEEHLASLVPDGEDALKAQTEPS